MYKQYKPQQDIRPYGFAAVPGTGPAGEVCASCRFKVYLSAARIHPKCRLNPERWSGGRSSDVLLLSPACRLWKARAS